MVKIIASYFLIFSVALSCCGDSIAMLTKFSFSISDNYPCEEKNEESKSSNEEKLHVPYEWNHNTTFSDLFSDKLNQLRNKEFNSSSFIQRIEFPPELS